MTKKKTAVSRFSFCLVRSFAFPAHSKDRGPGSTVLWNSTPFGAFANHAFQRFRSWQHYSLEFDPLHDLYISLIPKIPALTALPFGIQYPFAAFPSPLFQKYHESRPLLLKYACENIVSTVKFQRSRLVYSISLESFSSIPYPYILLPSMSKLES